MAFLCYSMTENKTKVVRISARKPESAVSGTQISASSFICVRAGNSGYPHTGSSDFRVIFPFLRIRLSVFRVMFGQSRLGFLRFARHLSYLAAGKRSREVPVFAVFCRRNKKEKKSTVAERNQKSNVVAFCSFILSWRGLTTLLVDRLWISAIYPVPRPGKQTQRRHRACSSQVSASTSARHQKSA